MHLYARLFKILILLFAVTFSAELNAKPKNRSNEQTLKSLRLQTGDEKGNELRGVQAEILVANSEAKAVDQIQKLIRKYRGTALEADLQFRLAELYMRRAKTDRFLKLQRKSETVVNLAPDLIKNAEPKRYVQKAVSIFEAIAKKWPRFERIDEVYYNHAFARQQLNQEKLAENLFETLIKKFPNSRLIPDAHLAVGEMNFSRRNFKSALNHFEAIKSYPDSPVYPYGLYKGAWTHYNLRDAHAGLIELEAVVKYGRFVRDQGIDSRLDLRREAIIDMALFFEDVYPSKKAFSYFEEQSDELDVAPAILRLSSLYKRHSRHEDNRTVLRDFIRKRGTSDYLPKAYVELMESSDKLKKLKDVVSDLRDFSKMCEPDSTWTKAQKTELVSQKDSALFDTASELGPNVTPLIVCQTEFQKIALSFANRWLKIWQKDSKQVDYADVTESAFEVYLQKDPKNESSAKARFVYAELLFKRGKYRSASENYNIAGTITKDNNLTHDSQYFAIISLEKAVPDKWSDSDEEKFKELAKIYLAKKTPPKYALDVRFKQALIAYEKTKYDEAAPSFKQIGQDFANTDKGLKAQDLYLDILNLQKKYEPLKAYADQLRKQSKDKSRDAKLTKIYEQSYFLLVQQKEESKNYKDAISGYKAFALENKKSPLAKEALWNALQLQFKLGDQFGGAESAVAFADNFGLDSKAKDALMKAAQTYEAMGQLKPAADVLIRLSKMDKKESGRWTILAADFYFLSDQYSQASKLYTDLLDDKDGERSFRALKQMLKISEQSNNTKEQEKWLGKLAQMGREPEASEARLYFVEKLYSAKDYAGAFSKAKEIVGNKQGSPKARASARLIQARVIAKEYRDQSVKTRLDRIQLVLQMKTEKLAKAQVAYQAAASYGDPKVAVISLKELGDLYMDYSKSLKTMEIPAGVPKEEEALFRSEMGKLAIPMEEKAYETKMAALKEAQNFGLRDGVLAELQDDLDMINQQSGRQSLVNIEPAAIVLPAAVGVGS